MSATHGRANIIKFISMVLQESFHIHDDQISAKKGENKQQQFIYILFMKKNHEIKNIISLAAHLTQTCLYMYYLVPFQIQCTCKFVIF